MKTYDTPDECAVGDGVLALKMEEIRALQPDLFPPCPEDCCETDEMYYIPAGASEGWIFRMDEEQAEGTLQPVWVRVK